MNAYGFDLSPLLDVGLSDRIIETLTQTSPSDSVPSTSAHETRKRSPPRHRHDGTSPLPLGMDWSPPPRKWDGRDTIWPLDPHTGWSYCVTVPSWTILSNPRGSGPIVFYRVQVGIQTPEAVTTIRGVLCRFSDFLKLFSELRKVFPKKHLPAAPPRKLLRIRSRMFLEERRRGLEDWMEQLLSDIDISRSLPVANFLELEAAARTAFNDSSGSGVVSSLDYHLGSDVSMVANTSSILSDYGDNSFYEKSEIGTPRLGGKAISEPSRDDSASDIDSTAGVETGGTYLMPNRTSSLPTGDFLETVQRFREKILIKKENSGMGKDRSFEGTSKVVSNDDNRNEILSRPDDHKDYALFRTFSRESVGSEASSLRVSEISNTGIANVYEDPGFTLSEGNDSSMVVDFNSMLQFPNKLVMALPSDDRSKFSRVLATMQRRLATAKTDMEDLVDRLNQELAVRQYLTTKVKDLEVELETTKENTKDNLQQAVSIERERFTQMQWDMEELRKKCLEIELMLKAEQDEKARIESAKLAIILENEMLMQELEVAREQFENLHKHHEEAELKSKADIKLLVKEVKSLRTSQSELKEELSRLLKEKLEVERIYQKEKQTRENANAASAKLLHECDILHKRLKECSVNFLIEEEHKLIMDTPTPSDTLDLLTTSENRIGLLVAEAQLLAQDIETSLAAAETNHGDNEHASWTTEDDVRKMLTDILIDNASLRKQMNSVIRCTVNQPDKSEKDDGEEDVPLRKTVLSKFLER